MKKKFVTSILAAALTFAVSIPAFAGSWQSDAKGWWWQSEDGSYPTDCAMWIDEQHTGTAKLYYFDSNGYMLANTYVDQWTYINASGAVETNGEVETLTMNQTLPASALNAGIPADLGGIYFGKHNGESVVCYVYVEGDRYFFETDFGFGPVDPYIGNGVFEEEDTKFIFSGNHLTIVDKITGNETYEFIKQ